MYNVFEPNSKNSTYFSDKAKRERGKQTYFEQSYLWRTIQACGSFSFQTFAYFECWSDKDRE